MNNKIPPISCALNCVVSVPRDEECLGEVRAPAREVAASAKAGAPARVDREAVAHVVQRAERGAQAPVHRVERVPRRRAHSRAGSRRAARRERHCGRWRSDGQRVRVGERHRAERRTARVARRRVVREKGLRGKRNTRYLLVFVKGDVMGTSWISWKEIM